MLTQENIELTIAQREDFQETQALEDNLILPEDCTFLTVAAHELLLYPV